VLFWRNSLDTVVERNLFVECDRAIALGLSAPDANSRDGETTYDHQGGVIRNNMVWQPAGAPTADVGITVNYANNFAIYHNTILLNDAFPWAIEYRFAASNGTVANNLTDGPIQPRDGAAATLTGNLTAAQPAWFTDPAAGDLHLLPTAAAAIDQAAPLPAVNDDYDGELRPAGPASDVGADEYGGAPFEPSAWVYLPALRRE
jgi:plastocyanin